MKTFRVFNIEISFFLSLHRVQRLTFHLPDWADDTCVADLDVDLKPMPFKIKYYHGSTRYYIDLPKCKNVKLVSLTPMVGIVDGKRTALTDRKIIVDLYF